MKVADMLNSSKLSVKEKEILRTLPNQGKVAINNFFDENSNIGSSAYLHRVLSKTSFQPNENELLYHYTTSDSVKKILKSRTWLIKQKSFMNDPKEFSYTIDLAKDILRNLEANTDDIAAFGDSFKRVPISDSYIWSFTKNKSSQTLFGNYSGNKNGVALGLNSKEVQDVLCLHFLHGKSDPNSIAEGEAFPIALRVVYDEKVQRNYLKPLVEEWLLAYKNLESMPSCQRDICATCLTFISYFALLFKNPLLRQEEEIRFVITYKGDKDYSERVINNVPYVKCEISPNIVREAILQTGNPMKVSELEDLFKECGFNDVKVFRSELPY